MKNRFRNKFGMTGLAEFVSASLLLITILFLISSCKSTRAVKNTELRLVYVTNSKKINLLTEELGFGVFIMFL